jgi:hypothetical protein
MTPRRTLIVVVLAAVGMWAPLVNAQQTFADVEVGWQWVDVSGNQDMYRTQLNDDDGLVIRDLSLTLLDTTGSHRLFDRFRIDASGFGGSPAGHFRLSSDLGGIYSLKLQYGRYEMFDAIPGWANPYDSSIALHTSDRTRDMLDLEIELLPGRAVTPIIGYRWNQVDGPRRTTYHVGQDQFRLAQDLKETDEEFRVGLAFHAGTFRGSVIQGWRSFESTEHSRLAPGEGAGINPSPVLGVDVSLDEFTRTAKTKADTPVTSAYVSGTVGERVRLAATYVRADSDSDTTSDESLSGSLVSYRISRFFAGLDDTIASRTENPSWRGAVRAGLDLCSKVVLDAGYERRHRELQGWSLVSTLYLDTFTFSGADPRDITELVQVSNGFERDEDLFDVTLRASELGPFNVWAGWRSSDISTTVNQDMAEIVIPGAQSGQFDRKVDTYDVGAGVHLGNFRFVLGYTSDDADRAVLRTDYLDRSRVRGQVEWTPVTWLTVSGTGETIDSKNSTEGIGLDATTDHWAVDAALRPTTDLTLHLAWDTYTTDSTVTIRRPQDFGTEASIHSEDGDLWEGSFDWRIADKATLSAGYSSLENTGTLPFKLERGWGRLAYDFSKIWGAAVEYESNQYSETLTSLSDFDASRYAVFVRWHK